MAISFVRASRVDLEEEVLRLRAEVARLESHLEQADAERDARVEQIESIHDALGCEGEWTNLHDLGTCAVEQVPSLVAEVERLREGRDLLREVERSTEAHGRERLVRERDEARADAERLRDVVVAAHSLWFCDEHAFHLDWCAKCKRSAASRQRFDEALCALEQVSSLVAEVTSLRAQIAQRDAEIEVVAAAYTWRLEPTYANECVLQDAIDALDAPTHPPTLSVPTPGDSCPPTTQVDPQKTGETQ